MDKIFGKQKTVKEHVRENKRELTRSTRDMDREILNLQRQEKLIQADIKKALKRNDERTARTLAKQIVQIRKQQERMMATKGNMTALGHKQSTMGANQAMMGAIGKSANIMGKMNAQMDMKQMSSTMAEFQKQNQMASMSEEMMDDVIDGMFDDDDMESETDQAMNEILDSIGIDLGNQLGGIQTSQNKLSSSSMQSRMKALENDDDQELESMLAKLRQQ